MTHWFVLSMTLLAADLARPVDFDSEIIPILTKAGCNAGACHGAAAGQAGFHLSLWGADPPSDYDAIVHAFEGRRINFARPELSLILSKPGGELDHGGGVVLPEGDLGAARVKSWILSRAPRGSSRQLTKLVVSPQRYTCDRVPDRVPLRVMARFDDGPEEDVTAWTVFASGDPAAVAIDDSSRFADVRRRGQHVVIARFLDQVVPIQFLVPLSDATVDLNAAPRANFIDEEILRTLGVLRLPVSPPADDAAWLRRVSLDLTGRLPEPAAVEAYVADQHADKRIRLVDALLSSDSFADYWTLRFARLLRVHSLPNEKEVAVVYAGWLRSELVAGTPLDETARQLLTATGDSHVVGPANFGRMVGDARAQAELVGQVFMGMRLACANCHSHPLDRWTQDDYHGLAAVFARLDRGRIVQLAPRGGVTNLRTGEPAIPRIPGTRFLNADGDHREELAQWLTSSGNLYFARATVNRLWRAMFGRGLVEPTDDLRETNPATHPELLQRLAQDFAHEGYSIRHTLRLIALSHTYGRSDVILAANAADDRFYSHAYRRPLLPEVLADAIADVTGVPGAYAGQPEGTRAVSLVDPLSPAPSLDILGRCVRTAECDENPAQGGGLPAQLHLLNGDLVNARLTDVSGRLQQSLAAGRTDAEILSDFHWRALCRGPTDEQLARWSASIDSEDLPKRAERLEDFVWSLLNSPQFSQNH